MSPQLATDCASARTTTSHQPPPRSSGSHPTAGGALTRRRSRREDVGCCPHIVGRWLARATGAVTAVVAVVRRTVATLIRRRAARPLPTREVLIEELTRAADGVPRIDEAERRRIGVRAAEAAAAARATRAPRTETAARLATRQLLRFIQNNPRLLCAPEPISAEAYDVAIEAWLLARSGTSDVWCANGAGTGGPGVGGAVRALLDRLNYSRDNTWTRSTAMSRVLGAGEREDATHYAPVFLWEVAEGLRTRRPISLWEAAAAALVVLGATAARRKSGATLLLVEQVTQVAANTVSIAPRHRPKQRRQRALARRTAPRTVVVQHWMIGAYVIPWLSWHQRSRSAGNGYLFPSIVENQRARSRTSLGRVVGGRFWVEPLRKWSQAAVTAAVRRCLLDPDGRTFQGLRVGNNIEMSRFPSVRHVTRRTIHERSLAPIIGSEEAYTAPFAEDFAEATRSLGSLRITRGKDGILTVVARSASAGEDPTDWVVTPTAVQLPAVAAAVAELSSDGSSSGDDDDEQEVVGDGDRNTRNVPCGRCGRQLKARDYGFLCDVEPCRWACCTDCHPGGTQQPLYCPRHQLGR